MTKKAKQAYQKKIDECANSLLLQASKEAFEVTENVYLDILRALKLRIEHRLEEHERNQ